MNDALYSRLDTPPKVKQLRIAHLIVAIIQLVSAIIAPALLHGTVICVRESHGDEDHAPVHIGPLFAVIAIISMLRHAIYGARGKVVWSSMDRWVDYFITAPLVMFVVAILSSCPIDESVVSAVLIALTILCGVYDEYRNNFTGPPVVLIFGCVLCLLAFVLPLLRLIQHEPAPPTFVYVLYATIFASFVAFAVVAIVARAFGFSYNMRDAFYLGPDYVSKQLLFWITVAGIAGMPDDNTFFGDGC